ncbi:glycosyltransferase family 1 protein [Peribacillus castrilensis]|uniref:glycosyltransferase family 1 protein n=1 Tax=Peribacillus castrilensis TaxID=2897690 RepID=UPI003D2AA827
MLYCKKIKILIISTTRFELDGITNVILNYYRAMDKSDLIIDFVIPNDIRNDLKIELESFGSRIYKISGRSKKPFIYVKKLKMLIEENKYQVVHAHGNSCTLALEMSAAKKGGAIVRIPHSHNSKNKFKLVHRMLRRTFNSHYTHAFACGQLAGEWLFQEKPFEIINNGIDVSRYKFNVVTREQYRNKYNLNEKIVIGHIGHFTFQKNHDFLIDVFAELYKVNNRYQLLLIGGGDLRKTIEEKVKFLGLSDAVIFAGKSLEVPQLMQAMDMIIMPSRFEGLPLSLVEAQTACLPCYVSDAVSKEVGLTDLVNFISLSKSSKEWATIINESVLRDRNQLVNKINNQIISAGYSITENATVMKDLYKSYYSTQLNSH